LQAFNLLRPRERKGSASTTRHRDGAWCKLLIPAANASNVFRAAIGEGSFSYCGSTLIPQEAEEPDDAHAVRIESVEDSWYVTLDHPMTKDHFISFIAYLTTGGIKMRKLYPEQPAEARFRQGQSGAILAFCNRQGLFKVSTPKRERKSGGLPQLG